MYAVIWPATRARDGLARDGLARIEVTCQPGRSSGGEPVAFLRIRDHEYGVAELYREVPVRLDPGGEADRWERDVDEFEGGYFHRSGKRVDRRASTWQRLEEIAKATLDRFTADVPQWRQESVRLRLLGEWATARETVTRLDAILRDAQAEERQLYAALHPDIAAGTEPTS
jgi:hypothetical protein